ncbi:hypothetical protein [Wolbachia endosymbiont of Trichogramma pretiosum]|uniref:hypothetical protein n=1 Tax=Wolbachia endosymbiont of Trichogramma pretiosum TaxID=125593 RepID=UPI000A8F51FF|nr:hypothetical protein [Wolbachia endosymbiont of Trichogramma pretiosum]OCA06615.1 hypothetical protein wTpre_955 [Wolbachia endosymbiont of Trichogramma pretiosum]
MNAIENVKGEKGDKGDQGSQGTVLSDEDLKEKFKTFLLDHTVISKDVKALFKE